MLKMLFAFLLLPSLSIAAVYKWTDENGQVNFGNSPSHEEAEEVKLRKRKDVARAPALNTEKERAQARLKLLKSYEDNRNNTKKQNTEKDAKELEHCNKLKTIRGQYSDTADLYRTNKDGSRAFLSADEKAKEKAKLEKQMKKHCK